jgi:hypothetical protein
MGTREMDSSNDVIFQEAKQPLCGIHIDAAFLDHDNCSNVVNGSVLRPEHLQYRSLLRDNKDLELSQVVIKVYLKDTDELQTFTIDSCNFDDFEYENAIISFESHCHKIHIAVKDTPRVPVLIFTAKFVELTITNLSSTLCTFKEINGTGELKSLNAGCKKEHNIAFEKLFAYGMDQAAEMIRSFRKISNLEVFIDDDKTKPNENEIHCNIGKYIDSNVVTNLSLTIYNNFNRPAKPIVLEGYKDKFVLSREESSSKLQHMGDGKFGLIIPYPEYTICLLSKFNQNRIFKRNESKCNSNERRGYKKRKTELNADVKIEDDKFDERKRKISDSLKKFMTLSITESTFNLPVPKFSK